MSSAENVVRLESVTKRFEEPGDDDGRRETDSPALDGVTFAVEEGSFIFLTGPSGAGKSTLVKLMYAELLPTEGEMYVCGRNILRLKRKQLALLRREVGVVHQEFHLILRKSARDNVALALEVAGVGRREALARADEALDRVRLTDHRNKHAIVLSGGEKQRVALARALVIKPRLLVADEPTGSLDPDLTEEMFSLLDQANARGVTIIVATHDIRRVDSSRRPVLYISGGRVVAARGRIEASVR